MVTKLTAYERKLLIETNGELPITTQSKLLGINRSSFYYKMVAPSEETIKIRHKIDEIYTQWPYYGSRRIMVMLNNLHGIKICRQTVQKHMREMGIEAIYPRRNLSKRNLEHKIYPYLLKNLAIQHNNQVWGTDITYLPMKKGWMYLVAYMDWYSRYVVSWEISQTLEIDFVEEALSKALKTAVPEIINSDQGSHFTSPKHVKPFLEAGSKISMDGRGRALDNIFTERLWRSLKYENIYINDYTTPRELIRGVREYFDDYNYQRPHQSLGYLTPAEVYNAN